MGATEGQDLPLASDRRRHWTTDRRRRHGLDAEDHCYLCDQYLETIDHIIVSCSFSRQVWGTILAMLGADASQVGGDSLLAWWEQWRRRWHGDKKKGADTLFALCGMGNLEGEECKMLPKYRLHR